MQKEIRNWKPRCLALLTALAVVVAPLAVRTARADQATDQARTHYARGKELFAARDYRSSIAEFAKANDLAPSPILEFNIGLAHDRLGEKAEAVRRYRSYLQQVPAADNRAAVQAKIDSLEAELKAETPARPVPPPPDVDPPAGDPIAPPPTGGGPAEAAPQTTGDAELDRVANIDIGLIKQRGTDMGVTGGAVAAPATEPPPTTTTTAAAPAKSKPAYKQWWFWVVVGVSLIILIDVASSDSGNGAQPLERGMVPDPGNPVLLRF